MTKNECKMCINRNLLSYQANSKSFFSHSKKLAYRKRPVNINLSTWFAMQQNLVLKLCSSTERNFRVKYPVGTRKICLSVSNFQPLFTQPHKSRAGVGAIWEKCSEIQTKFWAKDAAGLFDCAIKRRKKKLFTRFRADCTLKFKS